MGCKIFRGDFFSLSRVLFSLFFSFFFACRMERGHEEVLTSQARHRRGTSWEMPTASSLVAAMSVEELRLYNQIFAEISLEMSDGATTSTFGEANNVVYFTQEHFSVGLRLPVPLLMKWFLHFT